MKHFLPTLSLLFCVAAYGDEFVAPEASNADGLPKGQCTWYAHLRAQKSGWHILFDKPYDRHAAYWWEKVTNAEKTEEPREGTVMVFGPWEGNPYGHVAYVEKVLSKTEWIITHANCNLGTREVDLKGVPTYRVKCTKIDGGVVVQGCKQVFPVRGFLAQTPGERPAVAQN